MEDYKEKYEHGLECIQEILSGAGDSIKTSILRKRLQPFFPELKESEDERIRKGILYMFEMALPDVFKRYGINKNDAISYLEKLKDFDKKLEQAYKANNDEIFNYGYKAAKAELGEQDDEDPRWKYAYDLIIAEEMYQMSMNDEMVEEARTKAYEALCKIGHIGDLLHLENLKDFDKQLEEAYKTADEVQYKRGYDAGYIEGRAFTKEELEKQDEQKVSVDDFKAKNWYVSEVDGKIHDMTYNPADNVESKFKVGDWITNSIETVQITGYDIDYGYQVDCKGNLQHRDTDIIEKEYHLWTIQDAKEGDVLASSKSIFIFKGIYMAGKPESYCAIMNGYFFCCSEGCWTNEQCYPATKEERNILFQKMKEAGFEWDSEKKELKLVITNGGDFEPELSHKEVSKKSEQDGKKWIDEKVYWKEREELFEDGKQEVINNPAKYGLIKKDENHIANDRKKVEPKAWSEEDEKILCGVIDEIQANKSSAPEYDLKTYDKFLSWLKSIKERMQ